MAKKLNKEQTKALEAKILHNEDFWALIDGCMYSYYEQVGELTGYRAGSIIDYARFVSRQTGVNGATALRWVKTVNPIPDIGAGIKSKQAGDAPPVSQFGR